jgi:hypothetical protein
LVVSFIWLDVVWLDEPDEPDGLDEFDEVVELDCPVGVV